MKLFNRAPAWRAGLVRIHCTGCGRDLDWAEPEFAAAHPQPVCVLCQSAIARGDLHRATTALNTAVTEVLAIERPGPMNALFEAAVAEAEAIER